MTTALIIGGTAGLGLEVARHCAARGEEVVVAGRDRARAEGAAAEVGGPATGMAVDLADVGGIASALAPLGPVDHLVLAAAAAFVNPVASFDLAAALELVAIKLVGYAEVVHALGDRLGSSSSVVLFGGQARSRPYPGSTMVTTVNGGVTTLARTLAVELAPVRVNSIHPGLVGDSPRWIDADQGPAIARTPAGRLVTMAEVAHATLFLLDNGGMDGVDLVIDGGWLLA